MKNHYLLFLLLSSFLLPSPKCHAQLASPVFDIPCNAIGAIAKTVAKASILIKKHILPFKEVISDIQTLFKKSYQIVNGVILNLRMTQQLIDLKTKTSELFLNSLAAVDNAQSIPYKWKHKWILANLYFESRSIFEVFEISIQQISVNGEKSIMDDKQRILLIKETLAKARKIYTAMQLSLRRTQRLEFKIRQKKARLQKYKEFFEF